MDSPQAHHPTGASSATCSPLQNSALQQRETQTAEYVTPRVTEGSMRQTRVGKQSEAKQLDTDDASVYAHAPTHGRTHTICSRTRNRTSFENQNITVNEETPPTKLPDYISLLWQNVIQVHRLVHGHRCTNPLSCDLQSSRHRPAPRLPWQLHDTILSAPALPKPPRQPATQKHREA